MACTPLWTAPTAYFDGMTIANGNVYVTDAEGVQAFDAAGSKNCSGTPKVCAPLWATSTHPRPARRSRRPGIAGGRRRSAVRPGIRRRPPPQHGRGVRSGVQRGRINGLLGYADRVCSHVDDHRRSREYRQHRFAGDRPTASSTSPTRTLYAFDAAGSASCSSTPKVCAPLWTAATTNYPTYSAPAVANGTVYVGSWGSKLYAFDAAGSTNCSTTATGKTCTPLWTAATPAHRRDAGGRERRRLHRLGKWHAVRVRRRRVNELLRNRHRENLHVAVALRGRPERICDVVVPAVANGVVYFSSTNGGTYGYDAAGSLNCAVSGTAEDLLPAMGRRLRLHRRRIACHRQRSPLHQRRRQRNDLRLLTDRLRGDSRPCGPAIWPGRLFSLIGPSGGFSRGRRTW